MQKWITDVQDDTILKGMTEVCREDRLDDEHLPKRTKTVLGNKMEQVLEKVEEEKFSPTLCGT